MKWAVVMAGGRGTRFWPESREKNPKPFLKLDGRRTLLEETVDRLSPLIPPSRILVVLQAGLVRRAHRLLKKIPRKNILGEPIGKNTAPCCVWAAAEIERRDPGARIVFLPSDQWIHPKALYLKTLRAAFDLADERPVLLGMRVTSPHTGYGYLECAPRARKVKGLRLFTVKRFREKPGPAEAKRFYHSGNFLWNGGTFIWRLGAFKQAVKRYAPKIFSSWEEMARGGVRRIYRRLPSISLDYAVMEKMRNVHALWAPFQWSDLGGWEGAAGFWPRDRAGNQVRGRVLLVKSRGNIVAAGKRLVALLGLKDLLVVDTPDALLIAPRSKAEEIREVVKELEKNKAWKHL